jgi:plasmid stabilization system protein ParE
MGIVLLTDPAHLDRRHIWESIAGENPDVADRFVDRLEEVFTTLSDTPKMGRDRSADFPTPDIRSFPVGN